jgi:ABC-type sugar transport system permease subunit
MNDLLLQSTCNIVNVVNFLFVNVDEVISRNNSSWIFLHIYVVQAWKWIPFIIFVEKVEVQGTFNDVF